MNRAERRALKKNGYNEQGQKVYKLTQSQLDDMIIKAITLKRQEILEQVTSKVTNTFMLFCLDVLHSRFKFGSMRLKRFKYYMDELSDLVMEDYLTTDDVLEALNEEVDLEFMYRPIEKEEVYDKKKYWGEYEDVAPLPKKGE